jgi:tripartite-type tricarboxylate transporter receptor subunit TctC
VKQAKLVASALAVKIFMLSLAWLLSAGASAAGSPIRLVVIVAPGGSADAMARMVGEKLGPLLDTVAVVENKPGGGGNLATQIVAKATADGNTLLVTANNHTLNPTLFSDAGYQIDDLVPIADLMWGPSVVVVPANSKYQNFSDLLADARAHPNTLTYGSAGIGSPSHIAGELLNQAAHIQLVHVPYRGSGPSLTDLAGGQIPIALSSLVAAMPMIKAGKLRALSVTSKRRWPGSQEIPAAAEFGLPDFEHLTFIGMMAPKGTTELQANKLSLAVMTVLADDAVKAKVASLGGEVGYMNANAFKQYIDKDFAISKQLVQVTGMKPE